MYGYIQCVYIYNTYTFCMPVPTPTTHPVVSEDTNSNPTADSTRAVVIGPTSKVAAEKAGFRYVYSPSVGSKVNFQPLSLHMHTYIHK